MAIDPELVPTIVQTPSSTSAEDRSFSLTVTSGPDKGARFVIDGSKPPLLIGQSEACAIRLSDREVSRRHASLEHLGASVRIVDLGSTNGTRVDRVQIVEARLTGGEIIRVGATSLRIDDGEPATIAIAGDASGFGRIVGASREMRRIYPLLERLAVANVPVVLEGETGTGKEAVAEALHEQGPRAKGPFVIFDCTAVAPSLLEAELFGHERGAFTGAVGARPGVFEQAQGGTLFIDEIGDLDLALQPKLLRALERREVRRIGGRGWIEVDVRVLAATRRDLDREVEEGRFREDLFHRLAVACVELPPLRQRKGDVPLLARYFWERLGGNVSELPPDLMRRWELSRWPGNVRELRNAVARYLALGDVNALAEPFVPNETQDRAPDFVDALLASGLAFPRARDRMLEIFTERYVTFVLAKHDGNIGRAIESSGIGRRYFEKLRSRVTPTR